ncbi:hypothetical protein B0H17DRAFT_1288046 [Mycena rosella]|uniref:Uncharacterized protein n=1 Tax=Mycena rosella TaxID=1033263 RepID=A0AAD7DJQ9_MYCRO|nr:hypothetical protein B0H17DRAFT_1288046 [Mycena rosella]
MEDTHPTPRRTTAPTAPPPPPPCPAAIPRTTPGPRRLHPPVPHTATHTAVLTNRSANSRAPAHASCFLFFPPYPWSFLPFPPHSSLRAAAAAPRETRPALPVTQQGAPRPKNLARGARADPRAQRFQRAAVCAERVCGVEERVPPFPMYSVACRVPRCERRARELRPPNPPPERGITAKLEARMERAARSQEREERGGGAEVRRGGGEVEGDKREQLGREAGNAATVVTAGKAGGAQTIRV